MFYDTEEINIREYIYVLRKWKWMILALCVIFVMVAMFKASRQIPLYKATARLVIDARIPQADPFGENYYWDRYMDTEARNTQHMLLKSRDLARRVAEKVGLLDNLDPPAAPAAPEPAPRSSWRSVVSVIPGLFGAKSPQSSPMPPPRNQEDMIVDGLAARILVEPVKESHLVDVGIISRDPAEAASIVNAVAEEFIAQDRQVKSVTSREAVSWLVDEADAARQRVAESERDLQAYKEANALISLDDHQSIVMQRLATLSDAVNEAKINRIEFEAQYRELQRYTKAELETFSQVVTNTTIHWLKIDLSRAEQELAEAQKTYRDKHPVVINARAQIETIQARIDREVSNILTSFAREYEMAIVKERELVKAFEEQKQEAFELNQKAITYNILANDVESNQWVHTVLMQKMKEMSINERLETSNIRIVDRAKVPTAAINTRSERTLLVALVMGLVSGVSLAFFFEYLDNSIKTPEDVQQYLNLSFLGFIPKIATKSLKGAPPERIVAVAPRSIVSEAYRSLRTSVSFSALEEPNGPEPQRSILLITSAEPSEGKSCTIANLAIAMAQSGRKTLVVDCDFRRPQVHKIFNVNNEHGFADLLTNFQTRGKIRIKRTTIANLDVLPCGEIPPNPSELLESPAAKKIIDALTTRYDTVLLDSPPINSVTDPVILSRLADGVVLVIRAGETKRDIVQRATDQLNAVGAHVLGGMINSVDMRKNKYYYYYAYHYSHYYGKDDVAIALK